MKKLYGTLIIILCLAAFFGCASDPAETDAEKFCRVLSVQDDGMIVWMEGIGNVCVKNINASLDIKPLQTVVLTFSEDDLVAKNGTFTDFFGTEDTYVYLLENPKNMRFPDASAGEPTFG
jgi:hypothetical protein